MPRITFQRRSHDVVIEVPVGQDVLQSARDAGLPLASSCDGVGSCKACCIQLVKGAENLAPPEAREERALEVINAPAGSRLACCAKVLGDVVVTASYW